MMTLFTKKNIRKNAVESLEPIGFNSSVSEISQGRENPSNPLSFGKDFNLILAVSECGDTRIKIIDKELRDMEERTRLLTEERHTLQKLVDVVKDASYPNAK